MLLSGPLLYRKRRVHRRRTTLNLQPPVLVSGSYESGTSVTLTFDRAIEIARIVVAAIIVNDDTDTGEQYVGSDAALVDPTTVRIGLNGRTAAEGDAITLDAAANNGIVANDTRGAWAGVTGFVLTES